MGHKEFWDKEFQQRKDKPLGPEKDLVHHVDYFKKGTVLDIACGDGRNALYLLSRGFHVTGIDFSHEALQRLKRFASRLNHEVEVQQVDLDNEVVFRNLGTFDNIVINHYRLRPELLNKLAEHMTQNGILFVCGFGHKHIPDEKIKQKDLIYPEDFENLKGHFELVKYDENKDKRGCFVTYIYRRK